MAPIPQVAIFAHNEEKHIGRCLQSLTWASSRAGEIPVTVLVNGSTDRTEQIVREWSETHPNIRVLSIPFGDKANAWNAYVYSGISFDCNHYFIDGDCWLPHSMLDVLEGEFEEHRPLCVAPLVLNISESLREFLRKWSLPTGNGYGLTGSFLKRIVEAGIRIPTGFIGDDNLMASLLHSDLDDHFENYDRSRVRIVECTGVVAIRQDPLSLGAIRLQIRRLRRYALRRVQMELLNYHVRNTGLRTLPATARELYPHWRQLGWRWFFRWRGLETPYIWRALWTVAREARKLPRNP